MMEENDNELHGSRENSSTLEKHPGDQKRLEMVAKLFGQRVDTSQSMAKEMVRLTGLLSEDVMALLFDQQERVPVRTVISEEIVKAVARTAESSKEVMAMLLNLRADQIAITKEAVSAIATEFDEEVMALLLDRHGALIIITNDIVKAAAKNRSKSGEVVALLLDRRERLTVRTVISEYIVKAVAKTAEGSKEIMALLLNLRTDQIAITKEAVFAIATEFDEEVMALLLDRHGALIAITDDIVKAAARNRSKSGEVVALLLDRRRSLGLKRPYPDDGVDTAGAKAPRMGSYFPNLVQLTPDQEASLTLVQRARHEQVLTNHNIVATIGASSNSLNRLKHIGQEEQRQFSQEKMESILMGPEENAETAQKLKRIVSDMGRIERELSKWYVFTQDDLRAKMFFRTRLRVAQQHVDGERMEVMKNVFSIRSSDLDQARAILNSIAKDLAANAMGRHLMKPGAQAPGPATA